MLNVEALLNEVGLKIVNRLKDDIRNKQVTKYGAVNASGKLADSIQHKVNGFTLTVTGEDYIYYLEAGRRPGKRPPFDPTSTKYGIKTRGKNKGQPRGDYPNLTEWIENKPSAQANFGWNQLKDYEKKSVVSAIADKIASKGTTIYEQGGSDLVSAIINKEIIDEINERLILGFTSEVVESFSSKVLTLAA